MTTAKTSGLSTSNLILLADAQAAITRYVASVAKNPNPTYAFLIEHDDIVEALGITNIEYMEYSVMRVYFGLWDAEYNYKMRLLLVPVDDAGNDVIPVNEEGQQCVYDFNAPCPATCDINSPLYYGNLKA